MAASLRQFVPVHVQYRYAFTVSPLVAISRYPASLLPMVQPVDLLPAVPYCGEYVADACTHIGCPCGLLTAPMLSGVMLFGGPMGLRHADYVDLIRCQHYVMALPPCVVQFRCLHLAQLYQREEAPCEGASLRRSLHIAGNACVIVASLCTRDAGHSLPDACYPLFWG
jgi:hypothetical protein